MSTIQFKIAITEKKYYYNYSRKQYKIMYVKKSIRFPKTKYIITLRCISF